MAWTAASENSTAPAFQFTIKINPLFPVLRLWQRLGNGKNHGDIGINCQPGEMAQRDCAHLCFRTRLAPMFGANLSKKVASPVGITGRRGDLHRHFKHCLKRRIT
jgi:hypothetical protein